MAEVPPYSVLKRELMWVDDPVAYWKQGPCNGCADYCELDPDHDYPGEEIYCDGVSFIRRSIAWRVTIQYTQVVNFTLREIAGSSLLSAEDAELDAAANLSAFLLSSSPHE